MLFESWLFYVVFFTLYLYIYIYILYIYIYIYIYIFFFFNVLNKVYSIQN